MAKSSPRPRSAPFSRKAERVSRIDSNARIADGARIGADVEIGPYCIVGPDVELGDGVRLHPNVHITGRTRIGPRTVIYPFASLGSPPQSVHYKGEPPLNVAMIDLDEGFRMMSRVEDIDAMQVKIGMRVKFRVFPGTDKMAPYPVFTPAIASTGGAK